jgi:hypothetical protein
VAGVRVTHDAMPRASGAVEIHGHRGVVDL